VFQVAGGSGLTPMLQVIKEIARNPEDKTEVNFVFANQTLEDIILKKELDEIAATHDNINVPPPPSQPTNSCNLTLPELVVQRRP
jgi:cytochrome-b5 reductase